MIHTLLVADREITYDGRQLTSHWIYRHFNLMGDAAVAFIGPCHVDLSTMVDIEDVKAKAPIFSPKMLHVLAEFFSGDLHLTVYRQRLLMVIAGELLAASTGRAIIRYGDDLYLPRIDGPPGKISVSIATVSSVSNLIHAGFNVETAGTPVSAAGLAELGVEPVTFGNELLTRYAAEIANIWQARCKVRAVV
ncbi:DUF366 family protein [Roseiflexus sp.]|uniref:DUF366 family protein n=1 Tax=Roseiflexus sp. TaxID=2562120 RepID=UPI0021DF2BAC|nr:DUF366 family protein [Roseiflexus sp.]GIW02754.1 MAG: hypothetical protein KatS3mg058_4157 [Roseiflexus sp.]